MDEAQVPNNKPLENPNEPKGCGCGNKTNTNISRSDQREKLANRIAKTNSIKNKNNIRYFM